MPRFACRASSEERECNNQSSSLCLFKSEQDASLQQVQPPKPYKLNPHSRFICMAGRLLLLPDYRDQPDHPGSAQ